MLYHKDIKIGQQLVEIGTPYYIYEVTAVFNDIKNIGMNTYIKHVICQARTVTGRKLENDKYIQFSENSNGSFSTTNYKNYSI